MYCLLRGILPDKIKYICTAKPETESIVKPASIPTKMAVPSTILCSLMCCHAELNEITGRVPRVRVGCIPPGLQSLHFHTAENLEVRSISVVMCKSLNKLAYCNCSFLILCLIILAIRPIQHIFFEDFRTSPKMTFCMRTLTKLLRLLTKSNNGREAKGIVGIFVYLIYRACVYEWCRDSNSLLYTYLLFLQSDCKIL